ncbi:hypothetical protein ACFL0X_02775, partial [Nanoarchaeota archaeon]
AKCEIEERRIQRENVKEGISLLRAAYSKALNRCIDVRYRQRGFEILYALFNGHKVSSIVDLQKEDRVIDVGLDFQTHTTEVYGKYPNYPDNGYILEQVGEFSRLVTAGFHMWNCVEELAKEAHGRGLDVLVDEDLTEFSVGRIWLKEFDPIRYPTFDPYSTRIADMFFAAREDKPWLLQKENYPLPNLH